jgi:hypothetical protein
VRWSGRRRTGVAQIHVRGRGGMPEQLQVLANLSGSAHARQWIHRPQQGPKSGLPRSRKGDFTHTP